MALYNGGQIMLCPRCNGATKVCDTRYDKKENEVFRSHICKDCSHEFFTVEFEVEKNDKLVRLWKTLARGSGSMYKKRVCGD